MARRIGAVIALPWPPLLVITDRHQARYPLEEVAEAAFAGGCRWLSLREKDLGAQERTGLLRRLQDMGRKYAALVGVHDDLTAAIALDAALHLPAGAPAGPVRAALGPGALLGRSAHRRDPLAGETVAGLDYVTLSPVRLSASKPGYGPAIGFEGLAESVQRAGLPVIALGGIAKAPDIAACLAAGAAGAAVMGSVMAAPDPEGAVSALLGAFAD